VCGDTLRLVRLECDGCRTAIEGDFDSGRLGRLGRDQVSFVEVFLECRGKIKDVEERLGLSYPTVVARLEQVVDALGAPSRADGSAVRGTSQAAGASDDGSNVEDVLAALAKKEILPAEAARRIKHGRKRP
jgi:hypothetical protein